MLTSDQKTRTINYYFCRVLMFDCSESQFPLQAITEAERKHPVEYGFPNFPIIGNENPNYLPR